MANQQMTIPGMTAESIKPGTNGKINIDLDDQETKFGRAIRYKVFKEMVNRFNSHNHPRPNEVVAYVIDRQLLHLLMASNHCRFLILAKCLRHDKNETMEDGTTKECFNESLSFMALKEDFSPVGTTIRNNEAIIDSGNDTSSGEWIQGFTYQQLVDNHIIQTITEDGTAVFDFDKLFAGLSQGKYFTL